MNIDVQTAPNTPLNLRLGVWYAPRIKTPPFVAFDAVEVAPSMFAVRAYDESGAQTEVFRGGLGAVYLRFAQHLRMDVEVAQ